MARKVNKETDVKKSEKVEVAKDQVIFWKATKPLTSGQYKMLQHLIDETEKAKGIKMILVPHAVDAEVGESDGSTGRRKTSAKDSK